MTDTFPAALQWLEPHLAVGMQAAVRSVYGVLLLGTLLFTLPQARRFFVSDRWGGYAKSAPDVDPIQNPYVMPVVYGLWLGAAGLLTAGVWTVWAALYNLIVCRYLFIYMRWRGILRGMGAPGFLSYWLGAAIFFLELTLHHAPELRNLALLVFQVDLAFIMLSAGVYKVTAGFTKNDGLEMGLANPEWGYWWPFYAKLPENHRWLWTLNTLAWASEISGAILMLMPPTRWVGALIIMASFGFVTTHIRLGLLCEMVVLTGLLYFAPGTLPEQILAGLFPALGAGAGLETGATSWLAPILRALLIGYVCLLPFAHGGLYYNFYARKRFPEAQQKAVERYTNFFGMIIWRVFTADVVNFYIRVYTQRHDAETGARALYSRYGLRGGLRYAHVGECICITSLFTTLKYYPSNPELFQERLLRYAHTIPCPEDSVLVFEYRSARKAPEGTSWVPAAEFVVDPRAETIEHRQLDETVDLYRAAAASPVHEASRPGSYAPLPS